MSNQPDNSELTAAPPVTAQNAQPPAENPLDQLRDIHLPEPIDVFPYAPGWWILLAILLIIVGYFIYRRMKYRRAIRLLIPAQAELNQLKSLASDSINSRAIASLSALLKRVCLLYFRPSQVASLSGAQWLAFLNHQIASIQNKSQTTNQPLFDEKAILFFSQVAYQKSIQIEQHDWLNLVSASEKCVDIIIKDTARRQLSGKLNSLNSDDLGAAND